MKKFEFTNLQPVELYPGYLVYPDSKIESWKGNGMGRAKKGGILKQRLNLFGYLRVSMRIEGKSIQMKVHRLVGKAFVPNPYNYLCIDHKDDIKTNNDPSNLKWVTYSENNGKSWKVRRKNGNAEPWNKINKSNENH